MSKFKVGERARIIRADYRDMVGRECTIVEYLPPHEYGVEIDGVKPPSPHTAWKAPVWCLAKIIPPSAREWFEKNIRIRPKKKVKNELLS